MSAHDAIMAMASSLIQVDPSAFGGASWGVLGSLVFVILVGGGVFYKVSTASAAEARARDQMMMTFVSEYQNKYAGQMDKLASAIETSTSRMAESIARSSNDTTVALRRQEKELRELLSTQRILDLIDKAGKQTPLSADIVDRILRAVKSERGDTD